MPGLRLICWRFTLLGRRKDRLTMMDQRSLERVVALDWKDSRKVYNEVWVKFFGESVANSLGVREETWVVCPSPYADAPSSTDKHLQLHRRDGGARIMFFDTVKRTSAMELPMRRSDWLVRF